MSRTLLLVLVVLLMLAFLPTWPYSTGWGFGYYPSGGLALLLIVLVILLFAPEVRPDERQSECTKSADRVGILRPAPSFRDRIRLR